MVSPTPAPETATETAPEAEEYARSTALITMLRLRWFIRLRWVFLAAAVFVLLVERAFVPDAARPLGLFITVALLGATNLTWTVLSYLLFRRFRERMPLERLEIFTNAQVATDLLLLTCILRFTGGSQNPMAIFYLFHMVIVALLLTRWEALLQGAWAIALYAALVVGEWQGWLTPRHCFLPHYPPGPLGPPELGFAHLIVVASGILGMLHFTLRIASRLEARERELRQANDALRTSQVAIQDLQRRRSRFMQTAAHQLKAPLAVIQTLTELIRSNVVPPDAVAKTCDKIVRRCADGIAQVSELITLARVQEADPARHGRSATDVREVVSELCERFEPIADEKQIELRCDLGEGGEANVSVERRDLTDCIGNLIENAIKYTPGPGNVTVTVGAPLVAASSKLVMVCVADTGMGMPPEMLQAQDNVPGQAPIFDAFRRGNNAIAAGIPGTGLGLSIVREVVEQAGGRLRVTSRPNEGSSFTISLPAHGGRGETALVRDTRVSEIAVEPPVSRPNAPK